MAAAVVVDEYTSRARSVMARARHVLEIKCALGLADVPYDASCVAWALCAPVRSALGQPALSVHGVRRELVRAFERPEHRAELERDLRTTWTLRPDRPQRRFANVDEMLATFRRPSEYLPPILCAQALEHVTGGGRVQLLTVVGDEVVTLYESDGDAPYAARFFYDDDIEHAAVVYALPRASRVPLTKQ
jgi:hypothetical protein